MIDRHKVFRRQFKREAKFLKRGLQTILGERRDLEKRLKELEYKGYEDLLIDDVDGFLTEMAEILLVATYHWVERSLKGILRHIPPEPRSIPWELERIKQTFQAEHGIRIAEQPSYLKISILRDFANSWKHNPEMPSKKLINSLGIEKRYVDKVYDHLVCPYVEATLRRKFELPPGDPTQSDLVNEAIEVSHEFLLDILSKVKRKKPLQPIQTTPVSLKPSDFEPSVEEIFESLKKKGQN